MNAHTAVVTKILAACVVAAAMGTGPSVAEDGTKAAPAGPGVSVCLPVHPQAFFEVQAIDHHNLRRHRPDDPDAVAAEVAQIKRNMDCAAFLEFTSYLLFQEEAFPELLTWGGRHRPDPVARAAVREVADHAVARGFDLYLHCNEFLWPDDVGVAYGDTDEAWETYRAAIRELVALFPGIDGFEVTADETSGALDTRDGVLRFHNETARALASDGRRRLALMRTWQRVGDILGPPSALGEGDAPNVVFSVKNTRGDFRLPHGFADGFFGEVKATDRLLVEFDAWREYETHNVFPVYMGDAWAPRFRALADLGVRRAGVRFNWNSGRLPITERPWANWVNVFTFARLAKNPQADPDAILREFVARHYPPEAHAAAFAVYKASAGFVRDLYYVDGKKLADHGRVNRPGRTDPDLDLDVAWVAGIEERTAAMLGLVDALPETGAHADELRTGALVVSWVAKACALRHGLDIDRGFLHRWRDLDPESFEELRGDLAFGPPDVREP